MVEVIKNFFGNSMTAVEAFCGGMSLTSIIVLVATLFYNVHKGKKDKKEKEEIKAENQKAIDDFKQQHNEELEALKNAVISDLDNISNMLMLEAMKTGIDLDTFNKIKDLYSKVIKNELLDTDKLLEEKTQEIEEEKTTQEAVNENLKNIDTLNDLA